MDRAPEGPLPYLKVSLHWQSLLLDSPEMWSYIHIEDGDDIVARIHLFLHLSRQHPLEVAINFVDPLWEIVRPSILSHSERIQVFYFLEWVSAALEFERIPALWGDITLSALRSIHAHALYAGSSRLKHLLVRCPQLRYPTGMVFPDEDGTSEMIREEYRLLVLYVREIPIEQLVHKVRPFMGLQNLEYINIQLDHASPTVSSGNIPAGAFVLSSENLRELRFKTSIGEVVQGILSSNFRDLHVMSIITSFAHFDIIVNALPSLPTLRSIYLTFRWDSLIPSFARLKQSDIPQLRKFEILVQNKYEVTLNGVLEALTEHDSLIGVEFFKIMFSFHRLETNLVANMRHLLYRLRNARSINLPIIGGGGDGDGEPKLPVHMPRLLCLTVDLLTSVALIDAPHLRTLKISLLRLSGTILPDHFGRGVISLRAMGEALDTLIAHESNHWDSVETITFTASGYYTGLKTTDFRSLCSVDFGKRQEVEDAHDPYNAFNGFLVALIRCNDACPNLRAVKSYEYPVWALLIQVLMQRNRNRSLAQWHNIWLPRLPIQPLLFLIIKLLNGSPNEIIPLHVNQLIVRRLQHQLIRSQACYPCVCAGYTICNLPKVPHSPYLGTIWWRKEEDGSHHDRRSDPDYLELLELILDVEVNVANSRLTWKEWEDLLRDMATDMKSLMNMVKYHTWCQHHKSQDVLVRIHRHML